MKKKDTKLDNAILAYNRFEKNENVKVQLLDYNHKILASFFLPKVAFTKSWDELQTVIRFRLRKDFGYVLPKNCSYLIGTV